MRTILLISPYWRETHRWMVSSYKLADLWQRLGYRVVVVCMGEEPTLDTRLPTEALVKVGNSKLAYEEVSPTLRIYRKKDIFIPDPWNYGIAFGFTRLVKKVIAEEKPELIVCNKVLFWTSMSLIALRAAGHKALLLTDALVGITWKPRGKIPQICAAIYAWTLGWAILKAANRIVFFHPQPDAVLKRLGIARKSSVIPTGIDPAPYTLERAPRLPNVTVTYVGRLESVKGVDDFLKAVQPLLSEFPYLKAQVVGWYKEGHPLVKEYPAVSFLGERRDIPQILSESDIFVLPSYSEGLSNALMEAMASGCACVASDVGGNAYLIQNGVSGFLFSPRDVDALRSHLQRLIKDPAKTRSLGVAARNRIHELFSWVTVGNQYRSLFDEFLSSRAS